MSNGNGHGQPLFVKAFYQPGLTAIERLVLVFLVDKANGAGVCWYGLETIAEVLGVSRRAVHTAVHVLASKELIHIETGHRQLNHYHILSANFAPKGACDALNTAPPSVQDLHSSVQELHPAPPPDSANPALKPPKQRANLAPDVPQVSKSTQEKEVSKSRARRAPTPIEPLPDNWQPRDQEVRLGMNCGLSRENIQLEAERMCDWAKANAVVRADWHAQFRNWLRKAAFQHNRSRHRNAGLAIIAEEGMPSMANDDPVGRLFALKARGNA